jgi:type IV pilus assembly protein PilV
MMRNGFARVRQNGMTLIEILVAIVVLSIGLIGMAGLQLKGVQVNQGSAYRWQAAMLAEDIADRMRADKANALNSAYTITLPGGTASGIGGAGTTQSITDWSASVQALLPGGTAKIAAPVAVAGTANQSISITIGWTDTRAQTGAGAKVTSSSPLYDSYVTSVEF